MALSSMTGFARGHGVAGAYAWAWEIKSVNSKGLDIKLRLPPGWDGIEPPVRSRAAETLARGSVFANLTVSREGVPPIARVNEPVLAAVLGALRGLAGKVEAAPPSLDGILSLKGVIEVGEAEESEDERRAAEAAIVKGFAQAMEGQVESVARCIAVEIGPQLCHQGAAAYPSSPTRDDGTEQFQGLALRLALEHQRLIVDDHCRPT